MGEGVEGGVQRHPGVVEALNGSCTTELVAEHDPYLRFNRTSSSSPEFFVMKSLDVPANPVGVTSTYAFTGSAGLDAKTLNKFNLGSIITQCDLCGNRPSRTSGSPWHFRFMILP